MIFSRWRQLRRVRFPVSAAFVGPTASIFREFQRERLWFPLHIGRLENEFVCHGTQNRAVPDSGELDNDITARGSLDHCSRLSIRAESDSERRAAGDGPFVNRA